MDANHGILFLLQTSRTFALFYLFIYLLLLLLLLLLLMVCISFCLEDGNLFANFEYRL